MIHRLIPVLCTITVLVLPGCAGAEGTRAQYGVSIECENSEHYVEMEQYTYYLITITNTGEMEDTYNVTRDAVPEHWQAFLNTSEITVPAQESRNVMLRVKTTCECQFGERLLLNVTASSQSDPGVSDKVLTVTTYATVEIELETRTDYNQLSRGASYIHEVTVRNRGTESDTFEITLSHGTALSSVLEEASITLPTNTSGTVNVTLNASPSAQFGYHELIVGAESVHNTEVFETLTITVIVGEISLDVEDPKMSPSHPVEGDSATLSFDISNKGSVAINDAMITVFHISTNGNRSEIGSRLASIEPGDSVVIREDFVYSPDFNGISVEARIGGEHTVWEESLTPEEAGFGKEEADESSFSLMAVILIILAAVVIILLILWSRRNG